MQRAPIPMPVMGIDMMSDETAMPAGSVRDAENVDIDSRGNFQRRQGYTVPVRGTGFHSIHSSRGELLVGRDSWLYNVDPESLTPTPLIDMVTADPFWFFHHGGDLYVTNKSAIARLRPGEPAAPLKVSAPGFIATGGTPGALDAGRYMIGLSRISSSGIESPVSVSGSIEVEQGGSVVLSNLPTNPNERLRIYLTHVNGETLYRAAEFTAVFPGYTHGEPADGAEAIVANEVPMVAGRFGFGHNGRIYTVRGDTLYYSEPQRPHITRLHSNFIRFSGDIRIAGSTGAAIIVGDDSGIHVLSGTDPVVGDTQLLTVSTRKAVDGSMAEVEASMFTDAEAPGLLWLSEDGYMLAIGTQVQQLKKRTLTFNPALSGRTTVIRTGGNVRVMTTMNHSQPGGFNRANDPLGDMT